MQLTSLYIAFIDGTETDSYDFVSPTFSSWIRKKPAAQQTRFARSITGMKAFIICRYAPSIDGLHVY
jgi:hypothetical protein